MKIIIFEFFVLIKYFIFIISILGILDLAHRKNLVQAYCTMYILGLDLIKQNYKQRKPHKNLSKKNTGAFDAVNLN